MKESRNLITSFITMLVLCASLGILIQRVRDFEQAVRTYEERQQALISQDKAIRQELADLKRYIETGEVSGG